MFIDDNRSEWEQARYDADELYEYVVATLGQLVADLEAQRDEEKVVGTIDFYAGELVRAMLVW